MIHSLIDFVVRVIARVLETFARLPRRGKQATVFLGDCALLVLSVWIAYFMRLGEWSFANEPVRIFGIVAAATMIPIFYATGLYQFIFRHAGVGLLRTLVGAFVAYTAVIATIFTLAGISPVPRTLGLVQPLLLFVMIGAFRLVIRALIVDLLERRRFSGDVRRVLIYGAGMAGQRLAASMQSDPAFRCCGYIDDDMRLAGQRLDGLPVYRAEQAADIIARNGISDVMLALPQIGRHRRREILGQLSGLGVVVQTLPTLSEMIGGSVSFDDLRPLEIEDLLGREPVAPNALLVARTTLRKSVMVTGAGGSIGSELCRQIVAAGAARLVLFEVTEFALYSIHSELAALAAHSDIEIVPILGSIEARALVERVLAEHGVDTIYHAAAYKHVPLVEANPVAAVRNNVLGTRTLVDAAGATRVSDFILVSTDKAVRPTNVMGASKRAAEQIVQAAAARASHTRFSMVRFGNVLGSSGSVVPLFRQQIEAGGPITLTHREVTRYFMTISEAAGLVIQAGGLASGGEVFVLDMGNPVKIGELARLMIRLSGLTERTSDNPDGDIGIEEVGLRPGEKLYEELLIGENPQVTRHARIMKAREDHVGARELERMLNALNEADEPGAVIAALRELVPEFEHRRDDAPSPGQRPPPSSPAIAS
ncbi:MAG: nucleoside-diphosphate sugar epimerase/dehydratase [Erythrobacter sp.]